jgi:hypothetical protein
MLRTVSSALRPAAAAGAASCTSLRGQLRECGDANGAATRAAARRAREQGRELAKELERLAADIDDVREAFYTGNFGDKMQGCTARYNDVEAQMQRVAIASAAASGAVLRKEDIQRDRPDVAADAADAVGGGAAWESHLPDEVRSRWAEVAAEWNDLLVDASIM